MLEELQSSALRCVVEEVQKNRESGRRATPVQKLSLLMAAGRGGDSRTGAPLRLCARRLRRQAVTGDFAAPLWALSSLLLYPAVNGYRTTAILVC